MKTKRYTGTSAIFDSTIELARQVAHARDQKKYSVSLEFALTELVRSEMRAIAQNESFLGSGNDLLRVALGRVISRLEDVVHEQAIPLNLEKYERQVRDKLAFPAKEIQTLGAELARSRREKRLGAKEELVSNQGHSFVVHELGLRESIQGLLVEPTLQVQEIDVVRLRKRGSWHVEGDWFPYEVLTDEFTFVIDDDGSIFVSTANLPNELRDQASRLIRQLAHVLYE